MNKSVKYTIDVNNQGAVTSVKEIDDSLIKLDNTVENVQGSTRQLGTTTKALGGDLNKGAQGIQGTTTAVTNLNRVVQDAPFGIICISNNIEPLVSSFQSLRTQTGSATGALKHLAVSAFTGPGALITVTSLATSLLVVFGDELFRSGESAADAEGKIKKFNGVLDGLIDRRNKLLFDDDLAGQELGLQVQLNTLNLVLAEYEQNLGVVEETNSRLTNAFKLLNITGVKGFVQGLLTADPAVKDYQSNVDAIKESIKETENELKIVQTARSTSALQFTEEEIKALEALEAQYKAVLDLQNITADDSVLDSMLSGLDEIDAEFQADNQDKLARAYENASERMINAKLGLTEAEIKAAKQAEAINKKRIESEQQFTTSFVQFGMMQMNSVSDVASAVRNAMLLEVKSYLASALASLVRKAIISVPFPFNIGAATAAAATFSLAFDKIADLIPKFEQGGIVGGNRHSNGGTLVEAEQGEFIVNRNSAMQAPGLLNTINRDPNAASEIEALLSGQISRMNSANIGGGTTKVVLSMYELNQAQQQFNQVQLQAGVL